MNECPECHKKFYELKLSDSGRDLCEACYNKEEQAMLDGIYY